MTTDPDLSDFDYEPGTPDEPSIGGRPWNGSIFIEPPDDVSGLRALLWRLQFDVVWVMSNLITILDKKANRPVRFNPNRPQMWSLWNHYDQFASGEPGRQVALKGRQFGYSTLWTVILFICTALRGQNSFVLAHLEAPGKSIFDKAEMALKTLPTMSYDTVDDEGNVVGSQVITLVEPPTNTASRTLMAWIGKKLSGRLRRDSAENLDAGVGESYQNIQCTEVPLYRNAAHTIGGLLPAMANVWNTIVTFEFTARNEGDYAHQLWLRAMKGEGLNRAVFGAWYWMTDAGCEHKQCGCYARPWRANDKPFTPEELDYRELVAKAGHAYPLTEDGRLVPRLAALRAAGTIITPDHTKVGFELSDEQLLFRRDMLEAFNGDYVMWRREFPYCYTEAFSVAGRKLIPPNVMDLMDEDAADPLPDKQGIGEYVAYQGSGGKARARWMPSRQGRVHRFELPRAGAEYVVWCDPSSGAGVDPTGAGIDRVEYGRSTTVVTFEGFERPHNMARILARMGRHYRCGAVWDPQLKRLKGGVPAHIAVERNGFGEHVIQELVYTLGYKRVLRYTDRGRDDFRGGHEYGFPTTIATKMPMLQSLVGGCYDRSVRVPCRRLLASLRALQYLDDDDRTAGAPHGLHDDLAMGRGIAFHFERSMAVFRFAPAAERAPWESERAG